ncbi:hypothetical protein CKF54_06450 [Psittacicella hinzii]|uniref:Uncharacterized protein n=1 Tax=Psittacicella hinzii TaxID=2028575 RepID=A0A3A1XZX1_9GAMM|nr:hypothetical protein [Psittacicella hinzii]RIY31553.1 hypothetical protein CKF54_06450 [Psittacicella hinzii]
MTKTVFSLSEDPLDLPETKVKLSFSQLMANLQLMLRIRAYLWDKLPEGLGKNLAEQLHLKYAASVQGLICPILSLNDQGQISKIVVNYYFAGYATTLRKPFQNLLQNLKKEREFYTLARVEFEERVNPELYKLATEYDLQLQRQSRIDLNDYYHEQHISQELEDQQLALLLGVNPEELNHLVKGKERDFYKLLRQHEKQLQANVFDVDNPLLSEQISAYVEDQLETRTTYYQAQQLAEQQKRLLENYQDVSKAPLPDYVTREQMRTGIFWELLGQSLVEGDNALFAQEAREQFARQQAQRRAEVFQAYLERANSETAEPKLDLTAEQALRQEKDKQLIVTANFALISQELQAELNSFVRELVPQVMTHFAYQAWQNFNLGYADRYHEAKEILETNPEHAHARAVMDSFLLPIKQDMLDGFALNELKLVQRAIWQIGKQQVTYGKEIAQFFTQALQMPVNLFKLGECFAYSEQEPQYWAVDTVLACFSWSEFKENYLEQTIKPLFSTELLQKISFMSLAEYNQVEQKLEQGEFVVPTAISGEELDTSLQGLQELFAYKQALHEQLASLEKALANPSLAKYQNYFQELSLAVSNNLELLEQLTSQVGALEQMKQASLKDGSKSQLSLPAEFEQSLAKLLSLPANGMTLEAGQEQENLAQANELAELAEVKAQSAKLAHWQQEMTTTLKALATSLKPLLDLSVLPALDNETGKGEKKAAQNYAQENDNAQGNELDIEKASKEQDAEAFSEKDVISAAQWEKFAQDIQAKLQEQDLEFELRQEQREARVQAQRVAEQNRKQKQPKQPKQVEEVTPEEKVAYWRDFDYKARIGAQLASNTGIYHSDGQVVEQMQEFVKALRKELFRSQTFNVNINKVPAELSKQLVKEKNAYELALARGYNPAYQLLRLQNEFLERQIKRGRKIKNYLVYAKDFVEQMPQDLFFHDQEAPYLGKQGMILALQADISQSGGATNSHSDEPESLEYSQNRVNKVELDPDLPLDVAIYQLVEKRYERKDRDFLNSLLRQYDSLIAQKSKLKGKDLIFAAVTKDLPDAKQKQVNALEKRLLKSTKENLAVIIPVINAVYEQQQIENPWLADNYQDFDLLQALREVNQLGLVVNDLRTLSARLNKHAHPNFISVISLVEEYQELIGFKLIKFSDEQDEPLTLEQLEAKAQSDDKYAQLLKDPVKLEAWLAEREAQARKQEQLFTELATKVKEQGQEQDFAEQVDLIKQHRQLASQSYQRPYVASSTLSATGQKFMQQRGHKPVSAVREYQEEHGLRLPQVIEQENLDLIRVYQRLVLNPDLIEAELNSKESNTQVFAIYSQAPELETLDYSKTEAPHLAQSFPRKSKDFASLFEFKVIKEEQQWQKDEHAPQVVEEELEFAGVSDLSHAPLYGQRQAQQRAKVEQLMEPPEFTPEEVERKLEEIAQRHRKRRAHFAALDRELQILEHAKASGSGAMPNSERKLKEPK